ncbi:MAG: hypothetical protein RLO12_01415 [Fulvivirga sp.]
MNSVTNELDIEDMQTGWKRITINNIQFDERTFNFRVGFLNGQLAQLYFIFETEESANWEVWDRTTELKKLELYRTWLNTVIGTEREFNWGIVTDTFDEKAGFSSISINYKLNN